MKISRSNNVATAAGIAAVAVTLSFCGALADNSQLTSGLKPLKIQTQGSFAYGGTVITGDNGDTFHGDHGYVQYQIPVEPRKFPIVMWHGGGQFSKTWETTPDGREGYQNILLRQGFSTYILDQPGRGRAGRATKGVTIPDATPGEASTFNIFRLGIWTPPSKPKFFPGVHDADFNNLTKIPIQIIYGDNIDFDTPSPILGVELWRLNTQRAQQFVKEINKRGGHAEILFLPQAGLHGNTHFTFSDLNNLQVANLLMKYLNRNGLDKYPGQNNSNVATK